ncbi:hypothetical protein ACFWA9_10195 [Kitasatospora sp. NPDC059973]|uniref:hypothetical protein n=1 Tax=Kitasatospora sp. NPDC059973 TaxID=3347020 RepID=UPI0036B10C28
MATAPTDPRDAFAANVASIAKKNKDRGRAETTTKDGHTVLLTGLWNDQVGAIAITAPDGTETRRADGWKVGDTAEIAAFLWDVMEKDRERAAKRQRLAGLKSVIITAADADGSTSREQAGRYHLTPEQLAELLATAAQMASQNEEC